jgi:carboxyl-terminal processing protease
MHYSFNSFDDELSRRTMDMFIKSWDPAKVYFFKADVDELNKKYATKLDDMIKANDCSAIDNIMNLYSRRFEERQKHIYKLLDEKFDFTKDEYLIVDTKQMDYPQTLDEVNERWRKRVKFQMLSLKNTIGDLEKTRTKMRKRYELGLKRHKELTKDRVLGVFLNAFAMSLDPHSNYLPADDLEDFRIRTRLSLEGIGAQLKSEDGFTIVANLVKGGAAEKGGLLKENDKIIAVAQGNGEPVDVIDMDLQEVVKLIRGARGTVVKLSIIREDAEKTTKLVVPITREKIELADQQASSHLIEVTADENGAKKPYKIGVIVLPSFYIDFEGRSKRIEDFRSSAMDTIREINKLKKKGIDALIMDLRSNGGGSLDESIKMAGLFIDKGPVVQVKGQTGDPIPSFDEDGKTYYDGPLVVMINRNSASASEIFAGAIQDYNRGLIVGDSHSFGKGTVQNLNDIDERVGAVKITVHKYYRASGATTQLNGVSSDIRLPSLGDELEIGEKYYDYALPYEKIKRLAHKDYGLTLPYIAPLQRLSDERIKKDPDFTEILNEIKKYKENKEERSRVSLMEKKDDKENEKGAKLNVNGKDRNKGKKKRDAEDIMEDMEGVQFNLAEDVYMQEGARIAVNYVELLNKQGLANKITIKGISEKKVGEAKKESTPKKEGKKK